MISIKVAAVLVIVGLTMTIAGGSMIVYANMSNSVLAAIAVIMTVFGPFIAFLPLILSVGHGSVSPTDMNILRIRQTLENDRR